MLVQITRLMSEPIEGTIEVKGMGWLRLQNGSTGAAAKRFRCVDSKSDRIGHNARPSFFAHPFAGEMIVKRLQIESQFLEADDIVANLILLGERIFHAGWASESVKPAQERQANRFATVLAKLFMDVTFFPTKSSEVWIEAEPSVAPASE
jgi:hypothetical protein